MTSVYPGPLSWTERRILSKMFGGVELQLTGERIKTEEAEREIYNFFKSYSGEVLEFGRTRGSLFNGRWGRGRTLENFQGIELQQSFGNERKKHLLNFKGPTTKSIILPEEGSYGFLSIVPPGLKPRRVAFASQTEYPTEGIETQVVYLPRAIFWNYVSFKNKSRKKFEIVGSSEKSSCEREAFLAHDQLTSERTRPL